MAVHLVNVTAEVELILIQENLVTIKDEALCFVRMTADGHVLSEGLAIFKLD